MIGWHTLRALPLVAALVVPLYGCSNDSRADDGSAEPAKADKAAGAAKKDEAVPVEVASLGLGSIEAVLRFSTNLEAEDSVEVYSQAQRQVRELLVEEGDRVGKGQPLCRLQNEEQRTALAKVESQLAKARREYDREKRLFAQEMISEQAFNEATYELEQLDLAHEEAARQLSYTEVRAPIAGTVTQRLVNLGDHVTVNQHLFDIVDFGSIVARVFVPEKELPRLQGGQLARITSPALGEAAFTGRVERLAPVVDPKSGTVKVTVAIPENAALKPGMFVDVELVTDVRQEALLVPKRALVYDRDQIFVFRLGAERKVERVLLKPLLEDRDFILPAGSLKAGDQVVIAGQAGLKDGALVRLPGEGA
jgi:membrane fusion protein (multidrug efflux system)